MVTKREKDGGKVVAKNQVCVVGKIGKASTLSSSSLVIKLYKAE